MTERDRHHSQPVRAQDVRAAEPAPDEVDTDPLDKGRPPGPMTTLAFKLALDNMYRALRDNSAVQMRLLDVIAGVKNRTQIDQKTLDVLEKTLDELAGLRAVAYAGEASMAVITEVRDELRLIRIAAYASATDLHEIRESSAASKSELTAIRELLTTALTPTH